MEVPVTSLSQAYTQKITFTVSFTRGHNSGSLLHHICRYLDFLFLLQDESANHTGPGSHVDLDLSKREFKIENAKFRKIQK